MALLCILISSIYISFQIDPLALYYKIEFKSDGHSLSQFIVLHNDTITSIEYDEQKKHIISSFSFSKVDNLVSIKTINHINKICFYHEMNYKDFQDSMKLNSVKFIDKEKRIVQIFNKKSELEYTAYLSDSIPNFHPKTFAFNTIKFLPIRFDFPNRTTDLQRYIENNDEIRQILRKTKTQGYKVIGIEELKQQAIDKIGYSYEEIEEKIKRIKN